MAGFLLAAPTLAQTDSQQTVYIIQIDNEIELGLAAYLKRVLAEADDANASAVIMEINTPGGRLDATLEMRNAILGSEVETIAFINREAFSAGALIAISANEIYMTPGAVLGAATPVVGAGETADEKTISAVRSTFASTAELRGRDPLVAEAMVDPAVEIDGLTESGQLLTLTTTQAVEWGYTEGVVDNRSELLAATGFADAQIIETEIRLAERLVRFLTSSLVASLLFSLGSLLILIDLFTAGFGVAGIIGIGMLAAFFWGHFLVGLAGWEGVALVALGLVLLAAEAFVVPGFGVAGILGIGALLTGMFLSIIGDELVTDQALRRAGLTVGATFLIILIGGVVALWMLPKATRFRGLVLQTQVGIPDIAPERRARRRWFGPERPEERLTSPAPPPADASSPSLTGARGVALSDLRPGGFARIGGDRIDVVTEGDFIPAGAQIEVINDEGYRRVVRRPESSA